ncbi:hypothetical protein P691DRAFT_806208 [Macrolepiota fuliginosa MF-IS2]|uniref:C2 domain-containing protein n=1 Tax=Macrolepiota fuliginosa MF-IS2 TaxID=1400762 RepID=A0A9P5X7E5_9AGAR|nr:hypothetical protein P691DRAFT_806208 [Macrolepiota fuliginosa MF-IS2]
MDVVGTADPYFVAKIDKRISFVSKVIKNTLAPVWNEPWMVKNVPSTATLRVKVMDKDEGTVTDDYVGEFEVSVAAGAKEAEIIGPMFRRDRGTFWLKIESTPSLPSPNPYQFPYLFDGPIRYSRHFSPTVGRLTNLDKERLYSTWKMYIRGVPLFFGDTHQHWNVKYQAAQKIFGTGPASVAVRSGIQAGHRMLYARTAANGFGIIEKSTDVVDILHGAVNERLTGGGGNGGGATAGVATQYAKRVKPAVYTYIISSDDDSFRFSETGAAFFVDFASKHALHANCAETVRYSGEFHPRPKGGWQAFSDSTPDAEVEWELVIDNNSGTYAPDKTLLPKLKELLEFNFPGFIVHAWDREDPRLKETVDGCREYAMKYRGIGKDELQPTAGEGEVTLSHQASTQAQVGGHRRGGSDVSAGSTSSGQQRMYEGDAYASYYSETTIPSAPPPGAAHDQQPLPPPLPARPRPQPSARTSSDYMRDGPPPMLRPAGSAPPPQLPLPLPPMFPEPARYVPPSVESQYVPMENPSYVYGYNPSSGYSYGHEGGNYGQPPPAAGGTGTGTGSPSRAQFDAHGVSAPLPLPLRVGGYGTPPGTGSPSRAQFDAYSGSAPPPLPLRPGSRPTSQDYSLKDGDGYCAGQMSRFDPGR